MRNKKERIAIALEQVKEVEGYAIYKNPEHDYFFIVTPSDNVICICCAYFGGYSVSFEYVPSVNNGRGCACYDAKNPVDWGYYGGFSKEELTALESYGKRYARRLGAKLYASSKAYFEHYWDRKNLVKMA